MLVMCKCRVCGKNYEACHTLRPTPEYFRWQDVACSPECGAKYLAAIKASRAETDKVEAVDPVVNDAKIAKTAEVVSDTAPVKKKAKKNKA